MQVKRNNYFIDSPKSLNENLTPSSKKKKFLTVVSPSKSREKHNRTSTTIQMEFDHSKDASLQVIQIQTCHSMPRNEEAGYGGRSKRREMYHNKSIRLGQMDKLLLENNFWKNDPEKTKSSCLWNNNSPINCLMEELKKFH